MEKMKIISSQGKLSEAKPCICGHCGKEIGLDLYQKFYYESKCTPTLTVIEYYEGQCPICGKPIILNSRTNTSIPPARMFSSVNYLPENVKKLYDEMRDAYSVLAYTCSVIAGRTLLASIAVEQGAEGNKSFVYYVDYMVNNFLPKSNSKPWVDKVRQLGNDSAHDLVIATKEQAEQSLNFLNAILKNVYEFPNSI